MRATSQSCITLNELRAILDGPAGYGVRLEFLDIEMAREEQLSFFSKWDQSFSDRLNEHSLFIVKSPTSWMH